MPATKLRWGVLGTARIANLVVEGMRRSPNSELTAIASRDPDAARAWAAERNVPHAFGTYDDMLASDAIDAVYIPLPNALHKEWTIRAAHLGKHVLCEKPLASNAEEVREIIAARDATGVKIMEAFMYRFHPQIPRMKQLLDGGAIGDIKVVRATFGFYLQRDNDVRMSKELAGGSLMDVGCYCVNVANLITGVLPSSVTASANWAESGVDAGLVGTLEYPGGILATIDSSFELGTNKQQWVQVSGTHGLLSVPVPFNPTDQDATISISPADDRTPPEQITVPGAYHYERMVTHFAASVLEGAPIGYTLEESLGNMRVLDALAAAARTGQRVEIKG